MRFPHFDTILKTKPKTPWFEVITDDFVTPSPAHKKLSKLRENYPIVFHSVSLNIGGIDPISKEKLDRFKEIYEMFQPEWISDHLCWSAHENINHHDLMPIPRTKEALKNAVERINIIQDYFKRPLALENLTQYINFKDEEYSEKEFILEIIKQTDCDLLLDLSNVLINKRNKINEDNWYESIPHNKIKQIHLSGGFSDNEIIIDSHSENIQKDDIKLAHDFLTEKPIPILIERDSSLPPFMELEFERIQIQKEVYGL